MEKIELNKLFKGQTATLYAVAKALDIPEIYLTRYANGSCKIENMSAKLIMDLANFFKVEVNELYTNMVNYQKMKRSYKNE